MVEDWEIGALYWNCLDNAEGDEDAAIEAVKAKYLKEFSSRNVYFFVGTTLKYHGWASNPFVIIGVFYPPAVKQLPLPF